MVDSLEPPQTLYKGISPLLAWYNDKKHYCDITNLPKSLLTPAKEVRLLRLGAEVNSWEPAEHHGNGLGIKIATKLVSWQDIRDGVTPEEHVAIREQDAQMMVTVFSWRSDNPFIFAPLPKNAKRINTKHIDRAMNVTFQNFVNKTRLTQGMINFCVIVYMDDILVYSETNHGHAHHIEWTLEALRDAGFKIALEKSEFFLSEISFLGYIPGHLQLIVHELTIPLAQLVDDLPLEIVSQSDESLVPHVLAWTLTPYLQWSACLEEPISGRNPPSQRDYLDPQEIIDRAFFQDRTASEDEEIAVEEDEKEEGADEDDEEKTPEEGSYSEHSEGEQSEKEKEEQDNEEEELELEEPEWEILAEEGEQADA
ncbi:hypothetical protein CBR_g122 [Chara braunii]|uniref:Reverse transcriptase domain-containing protein n=1 Tax=Chara braunii TaxID=69332 RepID=A0A388JLS9_CHABU|nr:hypothetical protein CBR_g122 [Chara braunii]|eukprot:GBG58721.1 hypothetical protein CBR_g122 [Chara braunii]